MRQATDRPYPRWQTTPRRRGAIPLVALVPLLALGMLMVSVTLSSWNGTDNSIVPPGPVASSTPLSAWNASPTSTIPPTQTPRLIAVRVPVTVIVYDRPLATAPVVNTPRPVPTRSPTVPATATPRPVWRWGG